MINILVVDDEKYACDRLIQLVSEIPGCYVKAYAYDGLDAVEKADVLDIDVVLMDIRMPVMDGLEAARQMNKKANSPQVVFTTAYRQHALSAFDVNARGFLLKPIARYQLREKLEQLRQPDIVRGVKEVAPYNRNHRNHIYCRVANQLELIPLEDVIYFKSEQKYIMVKHIEGSNLIDETLKDLEQEFSDTLMRVHRGALVNKIYMKSLSRGDDHRLWLRLKCTSDTLRLSRRHISQVRTYLRQFSNGLVRI